MVPQPPDTHPSNQTHAEMPTMHLGEHTSPNSWKLHIYLQSTCAHICPFCTHPRPAHQQRTQPHGELPVHACHTRLRTPL